MPDTPKVHAILIAYNNPAQTTQRWERDVLPGLEYTGFEYVVTCVDNSQDRHDSLAEIFGDDYLWQGGNNLMYGPSINLAVPRRESDFILYACTRHGKMVHPGWVMDLIEPMLKHPQIGMTGHLMGSNSPEGVAHDTKCPWVKEKYRFDDGVKEHVQGGVFAARTDAMLKHPYPPEIPHLYTDHIVTWAFLKDGYVCYDVPTVRSVWRDRVRVESWMKYYHDESEPNG